MDGDIRSLRGLKICLNLGGGIFVKQDLLDQLRLELIRTPGGLWRPYVRVIWVHLGDSVFSDPSSYKTQIIDGHATVM
ncbi:hypothetical protein Pyn_23615 [Prunus yedoensis var. nudiflora]|uniref:Uncharacterized protein n=1 Tax=Prunus yedoensis var. nudiflora TaxID=2094558 RepID=A0A314ZLF3_PRUYE|nr:hypothetical protein Pyn_23615 [Prunus yedoensis var. nudiflora]